MGIGVFSARVVSATNETIRVMKLSFTLSFIAVLILGAFAASAQDESEPIQTVFKGARWSSGGYGALTNSFTTIRGEYANLVGVYGGWFINHRFLLGVGGAALTNDIRVPEQFNATPGETMSYEYGQFGLVTEYVLGSNKAFHLNFTMLTGAGFTVQYKRYGWDDNRNEHRDYDKDENFFTVIEPGVQAEVNLLRWLRFAPGISYRKTFGSDGLGMSDDDLSNISYNVTLKFGKF